MCLICTEPVDSLLELDGLNCSGCLELETIPAALVNLVNLNCSYCPRLRYIPPTLVRLKQLNCRSCPLLESIPSTLVGLTYLHCAFCSLLASVPSTLVRLRYLYVYGCPLIASIPDTFVQLKSLDCERCPLIACIPSTLVSLNEFCCRNCSALTSIPAELVHIRMIIADDAMLVDILFTGKFPGLVALNCQSREWTLAQLEPRVQQLQRAYLAQSRVIDLLAAKQGTPLALHIASRYLAPLAITAAHPLRIRAMHKREQLAGDAHQGETKRQKTE